MYKHYKIDGQVWEHGILRTIDNTFVPFAQDNTDYQEYLKWVAEGNTPQPAEGTE
jgi:hypothetical protein